MHTILVLGGYGFFGERICQALVNNPAIRLLLAGRDANKAAAAAQRLGLDASQAMVIDAHAPDLAQRFKACDCDTVIHTAGPFQGQDYAVARAAIAAGVHYIDLADGRDFVDGITQLNAQAAEAGVLVTSGASSLPALSSAVVDRYAARFGRLETIRIGIASGARAPGLATMRGVLGYAGKAFTRLENGQQQVTRGWLDLQRHQFVAPVGGRLLGSCDVPDLVLFPKRYPAVKTVTFHAGFASAMGHLVVWGAAQLVRLRILSGLSGLVPLLHTLSQWLEPLISDKGGMFVVMQGIDPQGQALTLEWQLLAAQNHGPHIPCGAAIALANRLARGDTVSHGAMPCMGLLTVQEYLDALPGLDVREMPA